MTEALKPCPFCGSPAEHGSDSIQFGGYVECTNLLCGARIDQCCTAEDGSPTAWNTRAVPQVPDGYALVPLATGKGLAKMKWTETRLGAKGSRET